VFYSIVDILVVASSSAIFTVSATSLINSYEHVQQITRQHPWGVVRYLAGCDPKNTTTRISSIEYIYLFHTVKSLLLYF